MVKKNILLILVLFVVSACAPVSIPANPTPTQQFGGVVVNIFKSTQTPIPNLTPEGDESECDNPFYPVADEATWMYSISNGENAIHTMSADDFGKFTINVEGAEITATIEGDCTPEGIVIMEAPGATTTVTDENGSSTVLAVNVSGVTLPKDIGQGQQWSQVVEVTTQMGKSTIETNYTAVGFENISVPAGEFYALKVEQSGYVTVFGQKVTMHGFQWLVEGVGVVKSAIDGAPALELVSYDIPD